MGGGAGIGRCGGGGLPGRGGGGDRPLGPGVPPAIRRRRRAPASGVSPPAAPVPPIDSPPAPPRPPQLPLRRPRPARFIVLGDSIAACSNLGGKNDPDCSAGKLYDYLKVNYAPALTYENEAVGGAVSADVVHWQLPA